MPFGLNLVPPTLHDLWQVYKVDQLCAFNLAPPAPSNLTNLLSWVGVRQSLGYVVGHYQMVS